MSTVAGDAIFNLPSARVYVCVSCYVHRGGDFLTFLRHEGPNLKPKMLVKMTENIAAGMEYLESRKCIHRSVGCCNKTPLRSNKSHETYQNYKYWGERILTERNISVQWFAERENMFVSFTVECLLQEYEWRQLQAFMRCN